MTKKNMLKVIFGVFVLLYIATLTIERKLVFV